MGKTNKKKVNDPLENTMSLGDHLDELRSRIIFAIIGLVIGTILCMFFGEWIITIIERPYLQVMGEEARMMSIAPAEGFASYMKITFIAGLIITSPWVFYQLWMFVAAGLYPHERKYVQVTVPFSAALFIAGALFFLFVVAKRAIQFLVFFNSEILHLDSRFTFPNYISFVTLLMLVFGIAFQTPIAILILNKTGMVSVKMLSKSRKYVIFSVFVVGAVLTPPEPVSQISLAVPLYALFEIGILLSWFSERKKKKAIAD